MSVHAKTRQPTELQSDFYYQIPKYKIVVAHVK